MDIFTLNYDGTVEIFCDKHGISYSDGFDPDWHPDAFKAAKIRIYKLHGSVYLLKSEFGKIIRIPVKSLPIRQVKYWTDENISEMMIYPALQKDKQSDIYLWLSRTFMDKLSAANTLVVIGYSFRAENSPSFGS